VRRYEYVEGHPEQQLDIVANKNCEPPGCYYPNSCDTEYLDGYYSDNTPFCRVTNDEWIPITGTLHYTWTGNIDCDLPPADEELDGVCVLGVYPETNDGTAKYSGFVSLDIRNIVGGCPPNRPESQCGIQYYNGASGQDATNKLLAGEWFCGRSWKGWRVPELGDQLAFLPGVSARFSPKTMIDCGWDVGDPFVAVVYSGYVWDIPDLEMSIDPAVNFIPDLEQDETYTVVYTGALKKPPESKPWESDANFELQAFFWEDDDPSYPITPTIDVPPPVTLLQGWSEVTFPITVSVTGPSTTTVHLSAFTVQARELGLGLKRWASANLSYGGVTNDFTIYPGGLEFNAVQGDFLNIPLTTRGFGFSQKKAPVVGSIIGRPWDDAFVSDPWGTVEIKDGADSRNERFTLEVAQDAVPGRYTVQLTVRPGDPPWHSVEFDVVVSEPLEGGIPTRFVIVEGFAPFEISYIDQNDVVAFAIGPIVPHLSEVTAGTRGALLPW